MIVLYFSHLFFSYYRFVTSSIVFLFISLFDIFCRHFSSVFLSSTYCSSQKAQNLESTTVLNLCPFFSAPLALNFEALTDGLTFFVEQVSSNGDFKVDILIFLSFSSRLEVEMETTNNLHEKKSITNEMVAEK